MVPTLKEEIMTSGVQEISEDYCYDKESEAFDQAYGEDVDVLNSDIKKGEAFAKVLDQLLTSAQDVDKNGINPTTFAEMHKAGLLEGTAFGTLGMETFHNCGPDSSETEMAMEALSERIKETASNLIDKIINLAKSTASKITGVLSQLWTTISGQVKTLGSKAWDKAKAAGTVIKAHPYATVATALTAAGAVAAIVAYSMTGTYANETALQSTLYKVKDMADKIHWPFGKVNIEIIQDGSKIVYRLDDVDTLDMISKTPAELGWVQSGVRALGGMSSKTWSSLKLSVAAIGSKIAGAAKFVNNIEDPGVVARDMTKATTGSKFAGWISQQLTNKAFATMLWSLVAVISKLLTDIAVKAFKTFRDSLRKLEPVVA